MTNSKKRSKKSQDKSTLKYKFSLTNDRDLQKLTNLLQNHTEPKLSIQIDGKTFSFTSKASRKKFLEGFDFAYKLLSKRADSARTSLQVAQRKLEYENDNLKKKLKEESESYRVQKEVIKLRTLAWEDRLAELQEDRKFLADRVRELTNGNYN